MIKSILLSILLLLFGGCGTYDKQTMVFECSPKGELLLTIYKAYGVL